MKQQNQKYQINGKIQVRQSQSHITDNQFLMITSQDLIWDINDKIVQQLQNGDLQINQNQINLNDLKQCMIESKIKSVPLIKYIKSQFTKQDKKYIKDMIKKQEQYQKKLQGNAQELEQKIKIEQLQNIQKLQQQKRKQFQERKMKAFQGIAQMKIKRKNRIKQIQEQNANLQDIKRRKSLHEKLLQKWKIVQKKQQEQKKHLLQQFKQKKKINLQQLKQHSTKYDQQLSRLRQSRIQHSRLSAAPQTKQFYKSVFTSRIIQEKQKNKQDYQYQKNMAKEFAEKKQQYAELVKQNFKPKVRAQTSSINASQIKVSRSLSHIQTVRVANVNKDKMKKSITYRTSGNEKDQVFKYKNYLTQMRIKKGQSQKIFAINEKIQKQKKYEKQIRKIMSDAELTQHQKFKKAKIIAKKMQQIPQIKNPLKMVQSIHAKLQILKHIST